MKYLVIIPARGGSKGIPKKNIKPLGGKPLIYYAIDGARSIAEDADICVSTDDPEIIKIVEEYGLDVPFVRPDYLASDTMGTYEVLLHALDFYEKHGRKYDAIVLLQPTSPFRRPEDIKGAMDSFNTDIDMVVSVKEATSNPYYNSFEDDPNGYLRISKGDGRYCRRQDAPKAWEYNGAVYVINSNSLKAENISDFKKVVKYEMDALHSVDLDTMFDWKVAELLISEKMV
ncbi:MAG: acylneuraminate cytidylyltransferase family protein [Muribaculaceae bacterium]|nr:acylneuraminate cytidylyltransferase family protein [Muribaculaceae bacterium]